MKKHLTIIFLLFFLFSEKVSSQNISLEAKIPFSGNITITTNNSDAFFDLQQGFGAEGLISFTTFKKHQVNTGVGYFQADINKERGVQSLSGIFEAEGALFSKFFTDEDLKIMFFAGARPGIGKYTFNTGDDIYISLGIEAGFKIKYKNIYITLFQTNTKGTQEPKGGQNKYKISYLGVSLGVILL